MALTAAGNYTCLYYVLLQQHIIKQNKQHINGNNPIIKNTNNTTIFDILSKTINIISKISYGVLY